MQTPANSEYTLNYFPLNGRAFPIRVSLKAAGLAFKDEQHAFKDWGARRAKGGGSCAESPLGKLPSIKTPDGEVFTQSGALMRYFGKFSGLYPQDALKALRVDEILDVLQDLSGAAKRSSDVDEFKRLRAEFQEKVIPMYCSYLESKYTKGVFLLGDDDGMSLADVVVAQLVMSIRLGGFDHVDKTCVDSYAKLVAVHDAVAKHPHVASVLIPDKF